MKKGFKECPFCANEIKEKAIKCQYCGEFLHEEEKKEEVKQKVKKNKKECPFCLNKIEEDANICPFCSESLDGNSSKKIGNEPKVNSLLKSTKRYKNRYFWILGLVIIDIIFLCNLRLSAYMWGSAFGAAIVRYVIIMLILSAIIKNVCKNVEDNPTNTKLTAGILYFLGYFTLALIIGYFRLS